MSSAAPPAPAMTCTIEKILTDAKTLLERLKEHDTAAESLIDQSAVLHQRVAAMREAGAAPAEKGSAAAAPAAASRRARSAPADGADGSRLRPHMLLCQENTQIRDLRQENRGEPAGEGPEGGRGCAALGGCYPRSGASGAAGSRRRAGGVALGPPSGAEGSRAASDRAVVTPRCDPCPVALWISLEEHQDALELIMSKYRKQMLQLLQGRKGEDAEPVLKVHQANSVVRRSGDGRGNRKPALLFAFVQRLSPFCSRKLL